MGLFKKRLKTDIKPIKSKFKHGDMVRFRYENELTFGCILFIREVDNKILYDIQVGGQCPFIASLVEEKDITLYDLKVVGK